MTETNTHHRVRIQIDLHADKLTKEFLESSKTRISYSKIFEANSHAFLDIFFNFDQKWSFFVDNTKNMDSKFLQGFKTQKFILYF